MSCTCCVCAWLPLTRGFGGSAGVFDPTTTKTVTWADSLPGSVVVDGNGPLEMQGNPAWTSVVLASPLYSAGSVYLGSDITFRKLDAPSCSVGYTLFPRYTLKKEFGNPAGSDSISDLSGSVSLSLYGSTASVEYQLTEDKLHESFNNPVYVNSTPGLPPVLAATAIIHEQLQSSNGIIPSIFDRTTPLADFTERPLDNLGKLLCWREVFNDVNGPKWNIQADQLGGYSQSPPITSGYTLAHKLKLDDESLLLLPHGANPYSWYPNAVSLKCVVDGQPTDEALPTNGFWTASTPRAQYSGPGNDAFFAFQVTGPTGVAAPYVNGHLIGLDLLGNESGLAVTLHRDGQKVLGPVQFPTRQDLFNATEQQGSYLVTVEATGSYGYPLPQLATTKDFASFVIDRTQPVVGFSVVDDIFVRRGSEDPGVGAQVVMATKPGANGLYTNIADDESPAGICPRPFRYVNLHSGTSPAPALEGTAGSYTLELPFVASEFRDRAGNSPAQMFSQSWTVHQRHPNFSIGWGDATQMGGHSYYGAIPKIEDAGRQVREHYRPRMQSEKVSSLLLTFDRVVDPATVKAEQVRLFCNGTNVAGCTIEQADTSTKLWRINVPAEPQQSATFCLLEYDPSGEVMTADVFPELHFEDKDKFPLTGKTLNRTDLFRVVYVADDTKKRYSVSVDPATFKASYVEIAGNPLDWNGNPYDPEPSVIVTRTSWLMADTNGWPRLIDTSSTKTGMVIGRTASISASKPIAMEQNTLTISATGEIGFSKMSPVADYGEVSPALNYDGFIPRVPTTGATGPFSYWGVPTTIDPSPPAAVSICAAPSELQWHSSAIKSEDEILAFELSFDSDEPVPQDVDDLFVGGKLIFGSLGNPSWQGPTPGNFNHAAYNLCGRLLTLDKKKFQCGKQFQGHDLAQNTWACVDEGGGTEVESVQQATETAYFVNGTSVTSSPFWTAANPRFPRTFAISERTFGNAETTIEEAQTGLRALVTGNDLTLVSANPLDTAIRSVTVARYSLDGTQVMLSACREGKTFPALKTTTLGPLQLLLSLRSCLKAETTYTDYVPVRTEDVVGNNEQPVIPFSDWLDERMGARIGGQPVHFYFDAERETWVLPPMELPVYAAVGSQLGTRTIVERVMVPMLANSFSLSSDTETELANGEAIAIGGGMLKRL